MGQKSRVRLRCTECGYTWVVDGNDAVEGNPKCPICAAESEIQDVKGPSYSVA
jgi:rubrerythrin